MYEREDSEDVEHRLQTIFDMMKTEDVHLEIKYGHTLGYKHTAIFPIISSTTIDFVTQTIVGKAVAVMLPLLQQRTTRFNSKIIDSLS